MEEVKFNIFLVVYLSIRRNGFQYFISSFDGVIFHKWYLVDLTWLEIAIRICHLITHILLNKRNKD